MRQGFDEQMLHSVDPVCWRRHSILLSRLHVSRPFRDSVVWQQLPVKEFNLSSHSEPHELFHSRSDVRQADST